MKRMAVWVVVDGNDAQVFPRTVRSTHSSLEAATRAARKAQRSGHVLAHAECAEVIAKMQELGVSYNEAHQDTRGGFIRAVSVEVMP